MNPVAFGNIVAPKLIDPAPGQNQESSGKFSDVLADALERVQELRTEADQETRKLLSGEPVEMHRVVLAGEKAGLAFELMLAVRNKVVDAYQEIMRMPV